MPPTYTESEVILNYNYIHFAGVYVPLTMEGNILVAGVLTSCYGIVDHDIVQIVVKPIQWYPGVVEFVFGDENGIPLFLSLAQDFGRWVMPQGR